MIQIKQLFDAPEPSDGARMWVEPWGLTKDLKQWCAVHHVLTHLGPPMELYDWFEQHPDGYDFFRAKYHEHLDGGPYKDALRQLADAAGEEDFTLLHQGDNPDYNCATALHEYLCELQAYSGD